MKIVFGKYDIQIKKNDEDKQIVYDIVRKKWIILTAEEQVRQIWLHYLVFDLKISISKIAVEKGLKINDRKKRFDICVYGSESSPEILFECKSAKTPLTAPNLEQLTTYNLELNATKFVLTNGLQHLGFEIKNAKVIQIDSIL